MHDFIWAGSERMTIRSSLSGSSINIIAVSSKCFNDKSIHAIRRDGVLEWFLSFHCLFVIGKSAGENKAVMTYKYPQLDAGEPGFAGAKVKNVDNK